MKIKNRIINFSFVILALVLTITLYTRILITTLALTALAIVYLMMWKSKVMWKVFFFGAVIGTGLEMVAISYGIWEYSLPNIINVPLWLMPLWGCAAMFFYRIGIDLQEEER